MAVRLLAWLHRFACCCGCIGFRNALIVFFASRTSSALRTINLPGNRDFSFRGRDDLGVVSHFYIPNYRIIETSERPIRRIIDAGANIGDETLRFRHAFPLATVVAIEPEASNLSILRLNFESDPNVTIVAGGLWPLTGRLRLVNQEDSGNESFQVAVANDIDPSIDAYSVLSILEKMNWHELDILKLDIEGAEKALFSENTESWINRVSAIIIEVADHEAPGTLVSLIQAISHRDFDASICGENLVLISRSTGWGFAKESGFGQSP